MPRTYRRAMTSKRKTLSARLQMGASTLKSAGTVIRVSQLPDDATRKKFLDLAVPGQRLAHPSTRVLIPIVFVAVANEYATHRRELLDQFDPFHGTWSSATLRAPGIAPLLRSA